MKFAVSTLDLLMASLLYIALKNACSSRFVKAGCLQNVGSIDPIVGLTAHDMLFLAFWTNKLELPHWILQWLV